MSKPKDVLLEFLRDEGIEQDVNALAAKRSLAARLDALRKKKRLTKTRLAQMAGISRVALDRLLDGDNTSVTLKSINAVAFALGKRPRIELADCVVARPPSD